jgi:methionine-S-sulfoxide reductase
MTTEKAILAGGCFWGMQDLIRKFPGVVSTRVGYTGGDVANATYRNHKGHAEAIEINYDPAKTSYRDLLEFFFQIHDPSTRNRQGNDIGTSYRSAIFYLNNDQKAHRRGHHRRRRRLRPLARQGSHRGHPGRPVLAGRARAPGLPRALPQRLHLPLPPPRLEAPAPDRRQSSGPFDRTGASPRSRSLTGRAVAPILPSARASFHLTAVQVRAVLGSRPTPRQFDSTVGI